MPRNEVLERVPIMGGVGKMQASAVIASVVLLAIVLGLARQPAGAQDLDEAARLHQRHYAQAAFHFIEQPIDRF